MAKELAPYNVALFGTNEPDKGACVALNTSKSKSRGAGYARPIAHNDKTNRFVRFYQMFKATPM
jgi:hypothetical protein